MGLWTWVASLGQYNAKLGSLQDKSGGLASWKIYRTNFCIFCGLSCAAFKGPKDVQREGNVWSQLLTAFYPQARICLQVFVL